MKRSVLRTAVAALLSASMLFAAFAMCSCSDNGNKSRKERRSSHSRDRDDDDEETEETEENEESESEIVPTETSEDPEIVPTETSEDPEIPGSEDRPCLKVATNAYFPPFEYYDGDVMKGFDIDVIDEICDEMNVDYEIEDTEFSGLLAGLTDGRYDVVIAGMVATEERLQAVDASMPYYSNILLVVTWEDQDIMTPDDLYGRDDLTIGVLEGTTGDLYASEDLGEEHVMRFTDKDAMFRALDEGNLDCIIVYQQDAVKCLARYEGLRPLEEPYAIEEYVIFVGKGNEELLSKINAAIQNMKETRKIEIIENRYIG